MALKLGKNLIHLIVASVFVISISLAAASAASADYPSLLKLIMESEDTRIDANDLAFFLATHDYDAVPKGGNVTVRIDGAVYRLTPNGGLQGLANIVLVS